MSEKPDDYPGACDEIDREHCPAIRDLAALRAELAAANNRVSVAESERRHYEDLHAKQSQLAGDLEERLAARDAEIARLRELVKYAWFQAVEWAERDPGDDPEESFNAHRVSDLVEAPPKMRRAALCGGKE